MKLTGPLARAARALVQWPRAHVARVAAWDEEALTRFEAGLGGFEAADIARLRRALEDGGAVFLAEDHKGGLGVRLKFNQKDVRAINNLEDEGGPVGADDV